MSESASRDLRGGSGEASSDKLVTTLPPTTTAAAIPAVASHATHRASSGHSAPRVCVGAAVTAVPASSGVALPSCLSSHSLLSRSVSVTTACLCRRSSCCLLLLAPLTATVCCCRALVAAGICGTRTRAEHIRTGGVNASPARCTGASPHYVINNWRAACVVVTLGHCTAVLS